MSQQTYDIGSDTSSKSYLSERIFEKVALDRREEHLQKIEVCRGKTDEKRELKRNKEPFESC